MASALELLARLDFQERKLEQARLHAEQAIEIAVAVLGESAPATINLRRALAPMLAYTNSLPER